MISFATHAAAKQYGRLVHLWLPPDEDEAHQLLVDLSRGQRRQSARDTSTTPTITPYDHARFADISASEGFSHHPSKGAPPSTGWMASYKEDGTGITAVHDMKDLLPEHIAAHREAAASRLAEPNTYQGGWLDKDVGKVYLDVSKRTPESKEEPTRQFALDQQQKAYFHLKDGTSTYLHPQHDPQMLEDFDAWGKKYSKRLAEGVPEQYRSYEHLYPPSPGLQKWLDVRGEHLAKVNRALIRMRRRAQELPVR